MNEIIGDRRRNIVKLINNFANISNQSLHYFIFGCSNWSSTQAPYFILYWIFYFFNQLFFLQPKVSLMDEVDHISAWTFDNNARCSKYKLLLLGHCSLFRYLSIFTGCYTSPSEFLNIGHKFPSEIAHLYKFSHISTLKAKTLPSSLSCTSHLRIFWRERTHQILYHSWSYYNFCKIKTEYFLDSPKSLSCWTLLPSNFPLPYFLCCWVVFNWYILH